ncbi:hypothetical protein [Vibrio sp. MA40-2]|uniref:hypothetical protein n=1 Tax=Vibrio sp. MA40-2 TaxID=3391828 RepID=UPI0039A4C543
MVIERSGAISTSFSASSRRADVVSLAIAKVENKAAASHNKTAVSNLKKTPFDIMLFQTSMLF